MPSPIPPIPSIGDSAATWNYLRAGLDRIMADGREGIDTKIYMALSTVIHSFCTARRLVRSGGFGANDGGVKKRHDPHLLSEDLYHRLDRYLKEHVRDVYKKSTDYADEALLAFYIREWNRYVAATECNYALFKYLNRHWVKRQMDEGKKNIYDIYTLHLVRWKDDMFMKTQENVMKSGLRFVEKKRNGETIEQNQVKSVVDSFVSLGLDESDSTETTLNVYKAFFEQPFLDATADYYKTESRRFLAENSVVDYIKKAETWLEEERKMVESWMKEKTEARLAKQRIPLHLVDKIMGPLMRTCETMLIDNHSNALRDGFQGLYGVYKEFYPKLRNGETIEKNHTKIVASFASMALDRLYSNKMILAIYREVFERPFLEATTDYYREESSRFLADNSVVDYMEKTEARLEQEKERARKHLPGITMRPLMTTCETVLLANHSQSLREGFQLLLDQDRIDDLARMYKLLARIPNGLDPLRTLFENHVRKAGLSAVEKVATDDLEPKVYVEALLEVHTQYQDLVNKAFAGESEFLRSLDNACREFVNRNKVCKSGSTKSPELLAKHTNQLLKTSGAKILEEDNMEKQLTQIMTVFKYIEDTDVFQKFYSRMLAKRLVNTNSASDDAEMSMIAKLKDACGFQYTNKLQRMFQDMQISKYLNSSFKEWVSDDLDDDDRKTAVDAQYHILGTGFWPLNPPSTPFAPPQVIVKTYERFNAFYGSKYSGRKLTWLWQLCKGEMKANYIKIPGSKASPVFQVSTYQMAILLLFNDAETLTYEDIEQATKLDRGTMDHSITVFLKAKVLTISPEGSKPEPGTTFNLNYSFKTKKLKVNLNIGIEQKQEVEDTYKTIEKDRKLLIQSAIVRIMKSRKKMKHQQLVGETISQIRPRCTPKVAEIKKCIDILLEKEYLERLEGEENDLGYLT